MTENQSLSARQLLRKVFDLLKENLRGKEIKLPAKALAIIAEDSDGQVGYAHYDETVVLLKVGGKKWAIAFGNKDGSYPTNPYNCDIAAVPVSASGRSNKEMAEEIYKALERGSYFRNSLIFAKADGRLTVGKNSPLGRTVISALEGLRISVFTAQGSETDSQYAAIDQHPVAISSIRYKPELATYLFDAFRRVLAASSVSP